MSSCLECGKPKKRKSNIYCSNRCQIDYQYKKYILDWKSSNKNGSRGVTTKNISKHLLRFLFEKYGEKCLQCQWDKRHLLTNKVPLEVDHIDGNSENNTENNLRLICPNCHSLTASFRNLNKGNGRTWRKKYLKSKMIES